MATAPAQAQALEPGQGEQLLGRVLEEGVLEDVLGVFVVAGDVLG